VHGLRCDVPRRAGYRSGHGSDERAAVADARHAVSSEADGVDARIYAFRPLAANRALEFSSGVDGHLGTPNCPASSTSPPRTPATTCAVQTALRLAVRDSGQGGDLLEATPNSHKARCARRVCRDLAAAAAGHRSDVRSRDRGPDHSRGVGVAESLPRRAAYLSSTEIRRPGRPCSARCRDPRSTVSLQSSCRPTKLSLNDIVARYMSAVLKALRRRREMGGR
jgi:hypothetical protein